MSGAILEANKQEVGRWVMYAGYNMNEEEVQC